MPHSRMIETMNTPDAGRFITQREFNETLRVGALEREAQTLFPPREPFHYRVTMAQVRKVMNTPMEITVYGMFLESLRGCVLAASIPPSAYAAHILEDAQDALGREMYTVADQLINQARWVLLNLADADWEIGS